jgi:lipoprotein-anchoring transpeptidase ErfK/SrfK
MQNTKHHSEKSKMRRSVTLLTCAGLALATTSFWTSPIIASATNAKTSSGSSSTQAQSLKRWIEIDLSEQRLYAWEGNKKVYVFRVSTGTRKTPTVKGRFAINSKYRINRMRGEGYDIPDVPYAMYFHEGYAIHGAYWHNKFGTPVSRGCVNLRVKDARRLYSWAKIGMSVLVHQ